MAVRKRIPKTEGSRPLAVALFIGAALIAAAACVGGVLQLRANDERSEQLLARRADQAVSAIVRALAEEEGLLAGVRGLFDASELVSREEFSAYVRAANGTGVHPGVVVITFAKTVLPTEREAFVESLRSEVPNFGIHSAEGTDAQEMHVVYVFFEPYDPSAARMGFDAYGEPVRRRALEQALSTGKASLTEPVSLIATGQPGFIMFLPVYRKGAPTETYAQRKAAHVGFVQTTFSSEEFFAEAVPHGDFSEDLASFTVFDASMGPEKGRFERRENVGPVGSRRIAAQRDVEVAGRKWTIAVEAPRGYGLSDGEKSVPFLVFFGGLFAAAAYASFMRTFARSYRVAVTLADRMTTELRAQHLALVAEKKASDESRRRLETLIERLPIGVYIVKAPGGEPQLVNAAASRLLGRGAEPGADKDSYVTRFHALKEDGTPFPQEEMPVNVTLSTGEPYAKTGIIIERPNGERVALRSMSAPIFDDEGKMTSVVSVFEDMTSEFEVDKQKSEFVFVASHQLRTPLTALRWFLELLEDGRSGSLTLEQKDFLHQARMSNERMIALVNELLNVSRIESGSVAVEPVETDLTALVEEALAEVRPLIEKKKLRLAYGVPKLPKIKLDRRLMRQAFLNLLSNAVKYTAEGGEIGITAEVRYKDVLFTVFDTGIGIPLGEQKNLFRKFFRGGNAVMSDTEGTGLGLYVCKEVVELSGGRIWFESTEGAGTRFYFTLPLGGSPVRPGFKTLT